MSADMARERERRGCEAEAEAEMAAEEAAERRRRERREVGVLGGPCATQGYSWPSAGLRPLTPCSPAHLHANLALSQPLPITTCTPTPLCCIPAAAPH